MEDVTATPADVLKGKTAYVKDQDDPVAGTLELTGNATDSYVYPGKTYYSTDPKVKLTGTMPTQATKTITPGASAQTVAAGRYLTGAITVPGFSLPAANTIKRGTTVTIYGRSVVGTFEGWVPTPQDLYYNGINNAMFTTGNYVRLDNDRISILSRLNNQLGISSGRGYNVTSYSRLIAEGRFSPFLTASNVCGFEVISQGKSSKSNGPGGTVTSLTADISIFSSFDIETRIHFINLEAGSYITRIRLE